MTPRRNSDGPDDPVVLLSYCDQHMGALEMRVRTIETERAEDKGSLKTLKGILYLLVALGGGNLIMHFIEHNRPPSPKQTIHE